MMSERMKKKERRFHKGVAVITVIMAIAFIGMLVAIICYMAYGNFVMKYNDTRSRRNFYNAEIVLDVINAGIQQDISDAVVEAYADSATNSDLDFTEEYVKNMTHVITDNPSADPTSASLTWDLDYIKTKVLNTNDPDLAIVAHGNKGVYIGFRTPVGGGTANKFIVTREATVDGYVYQYMTLENLRVEYTDAAGYLSVIETDIRVKIPSMKFKKDSLDTELANYSLIGDEAVVVDINRPDAGNDTGGGPASLVVNGNIFAGTDGLQVGGGSKVEFKASEDDTNLPDDDNKIHYLVCNDINVRANTSEDEWKSAISTDNTYTVYASDINVDSARLDLKGIDYIKDDLSSTGRNSEITLSGEYYGYGNEIGVANKSSSILLNGGNTKLDFGDLTKLTLAGNTYVGATRYDADESIGKAYTDTDGNYVEGYTENSDHLLDEDTIDEYNKRLTDATYQNGTTTSHYQEDVTAIDWDKIRDINDPTTLESEEERIASTTGRTIPRNKSDVMMGQSLAGKADQMMYLIPAQYVGYLYTPGALYTNQYAPSNPMSYLDYKYIRDYNMRNSDDEEEDLTKMIDLSSFYIDKLGEPKSYVPSKIKKVFRRVDGEVMVYFYLDFDNLQYANLYFRDFYNYNKEEFESYIRSYLSRDSVWPAAYFGAPSEGLNPNLTIAGNMFYFDAAGNIQLVPNNEYDEKVTEVTENAVKFYDNYQAAYHYLTPDPTKLPGGALDNSVFYNIVERDKVALQPDTLNTTTNEYELNNTPAQVVKYYKDSDTKTRGIVADVRGTAPFRFTQAALGEDVCKSVNVLVVYGDVFLDYNFNGLVIASGKIYVGLNCTAVTYRPDLVLDAMNTKEDGSSTNFLYYVIKGGAEKFAINVPAEADEEKRHAGYIDYSELIKFQNWKKG